MNSEPVNQSLAAPRSLSHARFAVLALAAAAAAVPPAGCMQTTIKASESRILTAEEAAESSRRQAEREKAEKENAPPVPPAEPKPRTPAEEIEYYRAKAQKEPQNPQWHFMLGMAYERQGKLDLAEIRYGEGAKLIPTDQYTGPHFLLGRVLAKGGKVAPALVELRRAVAIKPLDLEGYYLNPDYRESYFLIGALEFKQKRLEESKAAFRDYLKYGGERERVIDFFPEMIAD